MRRWMGVLIGCVGVYSLAFTADAATGFATLSFQQQWQAGEAITPNFWGPLSTARDGQQEPYQQAAGGQRQVQYFDKGRMELSGGTVTNGLLASELVRGQVQVGDASFRVKAAPAIPIAGDPDNPSPTYEQLGTTAASLLAAATAQLGGQVTAVIAADGSVAVGGNTGTANIAAFDEATKHNVPEAFADYRTKAGLLTIGFAISEPFWSNIKVAGMRTDVLVQVFQRRVLTYTPANPAAFQVEMGNIGVHYYAWRYLVPASSVLRVPQTVVVPAGAVAGVTGPVETGIVLTPGISVTLTATGVTDYCGTGTCPSGPNGTCAATGRPLGCFHEGTIADIGSLVAKVGDGQWFFVGAFATVSGSGKLSLAYDDTDYANNRGFYIVTISAS